jgi:hypothetical protein
MPGWWQDIMPRFPSFKELGFCIAVVAALFIVALLTVPWSRWHDQAIYHAIQNGTGPAFWWPPDWRREVRTSLLLDGHLSRSREGTVEVVAGNDARVFRTAVHDGRFSFHPSYLPAGTFRIRFIAPDESVSEWIGPLELDPGSHRLNFAL